MDPIAPAVSNNSSFFFFLFSFFVPHTLFFTRIDPTLPQVTSFFYPAKKGKSEKLHRKPFEWIITEPIPPPAAKSHGTAAWLMVSFTSKSIGSEKKEEKKERKENVMIPSPDCACCYTTRRMRYRNWRVHSKLIEWRVELKKRRGGMTIGIEETEADRALPLFRRECIVSCERITSPSTRPTTAQQDVLNPLSLSSFSPHRILLQSSFPFFSLSFVYTHWNGPSLQKVSRYE